MSEDQDLLTKISQLAGHINLHKIQQPSDQAEAYSSYSNPRGNFRGSTSWRQPRGAPYSRARGRARRIIVPAHRNRSLVLNGNSVPAGPSTAPQIDSSSSAAQAGVTNRVNENEPPQPATSWIAKRDRHMQLINPSIYDKETQSRTRAMQETRKVRAQQRDEREKAKISRHLRRLAPQSAPIAGTNSAVGSATSHEVTISGIQFRVTNGGSRLVRVFGDESGPGSTPKTANIGGVTFLRSKKGNLYRTGLIKRKRESGLVKKVSELCRRFTKTGTPFLTPHGGILLQTDAGCCRFCSKGPLCPYIHDPTKVAICKDFLKTGVCPAGDACDLSHDPTPERVPACLHFLRGKCSNSACRYAHVRVNPGAPVCRRFANLGYCEEGAACQERHVQECPDYANTGACQNRKCRLPHVDRAGQIRKIVANKVGDSDDAKEENSSDISSEDEDGYAAIDSDDVDSDGLVDDPMPIPMDPETYEISQQQDFVHF